ncbi:hypothetical protein CGLO_14688 [Colletotrichum gloeosporioides Cg-14]|uniref:Uncharacterized protein n=1 Tax=Colletotrichum gloeosporioides (strain Cg-14) TaxID=1237896 RepID=T0K3D9_COLGC|nr:hypothetical protein CGLO_14688 [Colletotrichum gloeosporioides Cg-14]
MKKMNAILLDEGAASLVRL